MTNQNQSLPEVPPELQNNVFVAFLDRFSGLYNWGRKRSVWPLFSGIACCAIEFIAAAAARFDMGRFGMDIARASPRQADLMFISGTITKKMAPQVVRLYNQMPEPKYVLAMGACAISGGPFRESYNVISGIDKLIPVDVYVPGCPPPARSVVQRFPRHAQKMGRRKDQQPALVSEGQSGRGLPCAGARSRHGGLASCGQTRSTGTRIGER